ncbi:DUF7059 domain-containing protein [Dermacoccaceae bacterium W4C1]
MSPQVPAATGALPRLAQALRAADYTLPAIAERLGERASLALNREQPLPAARVTEDAGDPVAVLVRLFALGYAVPVGRVDDALPGFGVSGLVDSGVVALESGDRIRAAFDLRPYGQDDQSWYVLSDLSEVMTGAPLPGDHVLGIGGASTTLASWTPRTQVGAALDLGAGCGVQSLHLSTHAETVVGTDVSQRALAMARANAAMNGLDWDLRAGDLLQPVAGEQFDLIVSNPPFVITPRDAEVPAYDYRDGGRVGHAVVAELVSQVHEHLRPGGVAQLLGNWEVPDGGDWREVVGSWVSGTGLDAWVVQRESQDPCQYAELWSGDGGHRAGTPGYETMYRAWLDDFEGRGVDRIGFGVITLQRPQKPREPWLELTEANGRVDSPMGPTILAGLAARSWLAQEGDAGTLGTRWKVAADVTDERFGKPGDDDPTVILARQGGGLGKVVRLDTVSAALLSVCDGQLPAGPALEAIASLTGISADAARDQALPVLRELIADGFVYAAG